MHELLDHARKSTRLPYRPPPPPILGFQAPRKGERKIENRNRHMTFHPILFSWVYEPKYMVCTVSLYSGKLATTATAPFPPPRETRLSFCSFVTLGYQMVYSSLQIQLFPFSTGQPALHVCMPYLLGYSKNATY